MIYDGPGILLLCRKCGEQPPWPQRVFGQMVRLPDEEGAGWGLLRADRRGRLAEGQPRLSVLRKVQTFGTAQLSTARCGHKPTPSLRHLSRLAEDAEQRGEPRVYL